MHPLMRAYLDKAELESKAVLWFDCRAEYYNRLDALDHLILSLS